MTRHKEILSYYDNLASTYDQNRFDNSYGNYIHKQEEKIIQNFLPQNPENNILSVACGTGRFMEYATHGIDFSENMIEEAKRKFPQKQFTKSDADCTNFENNSVDSIFCFHLFMHLEKELCRKIIAEMGRISKSGARFIFDFPAAKRRKHIKRRADNWHGSTHFDMDEISNYLSGWRVIHHEGVLFLPIHRFPTALRKLCRKLDTLLCRSFLKEYASYTILVLEKL